MCSSEELLHQAVKHSRVASGCSCISMHGSASWDWNFGRRNPPQSFPSRDLYAVVLATARTPHSLRKQAHRNAIRIHNQTTDNICVQTHTLQCRSVFVFAVQLIETISTTSQQGAQAPSSATRSSAAARRPWAPR
jgi:hypothetical protein